ncbi:peptide-binding protein, partial [Streptomyces sp. DSM 41529]|nr:peptide-binding protein [Streptomyces sp. DSM 41529]
SSKRVDKLISATQQLSDRGRTSNDFKEMQRLVGEDVPLLPLWQKKEYVVAKSEVAGSQYLSDGTGLWRLWELGRI